MDKSNFYFDLPEHLIAQTPLEIRDSSRLLAMNATSGAILHRHFYDILHFFKPGDCIVLNNSRVIPARLVGIRVDTGVLVEVLLLADKGNDVWECLTRPGKKTKVGTDLSFGEGLLTSIVVDIDEESGNRFIKFEYDGIFLEILDKLGTMPLPPYIKAKLDDKERYQTVYSNSPGSAAAPTAGLHFTKQLLQDICEMGVSLAYLTLHVGLGTFRPVKVQNVLDHKMHSEFYSLDNYNANVINNAIKSGGRVFSVGTTTCRTLESIADSDRVVSPGSGWTDIFIYPGYNFKIVDCLITNFHLPESTLIMLVSAFSDRDKIISAYNEAIDRKYRFFSFGDAMLLYREDNNV